MGHAAVRAATVGAVVRVAGLSKRYGALQALRRVDLEVRPGEIYGLLGPDGAGKSTLLKATVGVLSYDEGSVHLLDVGIDSERAAERIRDRVGFMPQGLGLNLYPDLSIEENIEFFAQLRGVSAEQLSIRGRELLETTRLAPFRARAVKHLSGGMKQKLGLICALIHTPDLVVLDEPTTGVDPVSRRDFWAIVTTLVHEQGMAALVATSYLDEADRFDRVSLVFEGRVLATGAPKDLVASTPGAAALEDVFIERMGREPQVEKAIALPRLSNRAAPTRREDCDTAIEALELTREFGSFRAVDRVSFSVRQGEIFGLLGANGAGKTTVIKMLTGIVRPTHGQGHVAGVDMRSAGAAIKRRIGYVSQSFSLYSELTVAENLALFAGVYGLDRRRARERTGWVTELLDLGAAPKRTAGSLPMGLRQRLALGCALLHAPKVVFLDEPTSGVDPLGRLRLWELLSWLAREQDVAILVTTHHLNEAERCDRLGLMFAGRLVADASPAALKAEVEREAGQLLEIRGASVAAVVRELAAGGFPRTEVFGRSVRLFSRAPVEDVGRIRRVLSAAQVAVHDIARCELTVEDAYLYRVAALEAEARGDSAS